MLCVQLFCRCRLAGEKFGFAASIEPKKATVLQRDIEECDLDANVLRQQAAEIVSINSDVEMSSESDSSSVKVLGKGTAQLGEGGPCTWEVDDTSDLEAEYADIIEQQEKHRKSNTDSVKKDVVQVDLTGNCKKSAALTLLC